MRIGRASSLSRNSGIEIRERLLRHTGNLSSECYDPLFGSLLSQEPDVPPHAHHVHRSCPRRRARRGLVMTFGLAAQQPSATPPHPRQGREPSRHPERDGHLRQRETAVRSGRHRRRGRLDLVHRPGRRRVEPSLAIPTTPRSSDAVIDATGKYVMPGIVNAHMHWHEERQPGVPQPIQYERNLYLAAGVTTAREVGGDFDKSKRWQAESNAHTIISPRILVYPFVSKGRTGIAGRDPRVDPRHQAEGRRRPEDHRHGSRPARGDHGRGAQAGAAHGHAHRGRGDDREGLRRARRQLDRALLRRRRRGAHRHPELSARHELLERDSPLRTRRRAVRAGRSREASQSAST